ncbi:MAG: bifunctional DNA primase/polymerase [Actinomycetota bacterium]|nr:bifunctional DNA primase/polymerase [Actinomycetota bacterium]
MVEQLPPRAGGYRNPSRGSTPNGAKAVAYARKSVPVFPCKPGEKTPAYERRTLEHGHKDATTDEEQIRRWWAKWPDANVATPTGKATGRVSLDIDTYKPGAWTPADVERELGELPETLVIETGRGGLQYWFEHPEGEELPGSPEDTLGPGVCVKSKGGYCLLPPSTTKNAYRVLHNRPLAPAPKWLVKALREPPSAPSEEKSNANSTVAHLPVNAGPDGPTIGEGNRNRELYKIGCSLRARGLDRGAILAHLEAVYEARCQKSPPMDAGELKKIARQAAKHAPGNASPEVTPEVHEALDALRAAWWGHEWKGAGGGSERDVQHALIEWARMRGTMIPAGVRVSVGYRTVALLAGVGVSTVYRAIRRLRKAGLVRKDDAHRKAEEAGAFVLVSPPREVEHSNHPAGHLVSKEPGITCVPPLAPHVEDPAAAPTAPRMRHSRPVFDGGERVGTISRLGKTAGAVIDHLEAAGGTLALEDLADALAGENGKRPRPRDLKRDTPAYTGPVAKLETAGVVECSGDAVSLTSDHLDALNCRREQDGEIADFHRDVRHYKEQQQAYRNRNKRSADPAPTEEEMRERREGYPERRRAGIEAAIAMLFTDRPEYRGRRVGQIVCKLHDYLPADFPRGSDGYPKDREVEAILDGEDVAA